MVVQWHLYTGSRNLKHHMKNIPKVTDRMSPLQPKENAHFQLKYAMEETLAFLKKKKKYFGAKHFRDIVEEQSFLT